MARESLDSPQSHQSAGSRLASAAAPPNPHGAPQATRIRFQIKPHPLSENIGTLQAPTAAKRSPWPHLLAQRAPLSLLAPPSSPKIAPPQSMPLLFQSIAPQQKHAWPPEQAPRPPETRVPSTSMPSALVTKPLAQSALPPRA